MEGSSRLINSMISLDGVMGYPSQASKEKGDELNKVIIERLVELIEEMKNTKLS